MPEATGANQKPLFNFIKNVILAVHRENRDNARACPFSPQTNEKKTRNATAD
jgi:hypothetical protein